jgi:hypothetical protein
MAALRIDHSQIFRLAAPPGIDEIGFMAATAADTAVIVPPAIADEALAHDIIYFNLLIFIRYLLLTS